MLLNENASRVATRDALDAAVPTPAGAYVIELDTTNPMCAQGAHLTDEDADPEPVPTYPETNGCPRCWEREAERTGRGGSRCERCPLQSRGRGYMSAPRSLNQI